MRAIFGVVILIVVVTIVALVAKNQLQPGGGVAARSQAALDASAGAGVPASARDMTLPQASKSYQEQARARATQAVQQAAERIDRSAP